MVSQSAELAKALEVLDLGPEHAALVAYCQGLAEVIDEHSDRASLWREYRPALELLARAGEVEADDGQAALLELVRTPLGHTADAGADVVGAGGGGGGPKSGSAVDAVAAASRGRRARASS